MANNTSSTILREIANSERIALLSKNLPLPPDVILQEYSVDTNTFVIDNNLNEHIPDYIQNNYNNDVIISTPNGSNKFTSENPYNFGNDKASRVFDIVNGIADVYRGNSIVGNIGTDNFETNTKLQNSLLGRILNNPNESELGRIGLQNLTILFTKRASEKYLQGLIPTVDVRDESGRISLKPNEWSISAPYVSDSRAFRFYYIGSPIQEPSVIGRDHSLPPNTVGGQVIFKGIDLDDEGFGRLVYSNSNLILSQNNLTNPTENQNKIGKSLEWENQQSVRDNLIENAFRGSNPYKRGILRFTQQLINDGHSDGTDKYHPGKIITMPFKSGDEATDPSKGALPRGTRVGVTYNLDGTESGTYCRNWTKNRRYSNIDSLVRGGNSTSIRGNFLTRPNGSLSVLQDNGFVRVGYDKENIDAKQFMLSIENLAWTDLLNDLPELERGSNGGRLMWFAPYDISFSEQNTANWESTQFLGRVEPVYTYNNSERTGTLDFTIISDYPAILDSNEFSNLPYEEFQKYFWGCTPDIPDLPDFNVENDIIVNGSQQTQKIELAKVTAYYENDITEIEPTYSGWTIGYSDGYSGFTNKIEEIKDLINQYPDRKIIIEVQGSASERCVPGPNIPNRDCSNYNSKLLPNNRRDNFIEFLKEQQLDLFNNNITYKPIQPLIPSGLGDTPDSDVERKSRFAIATVTVGDFVDSSNTLKYVKKSSKSDNVQLDERNEKPFEKIDNDFIFEDDIEYESLRKDAIMNGLFKEKLKEKIKHFHPAFHSTTPQGLNRRLTFLVQCTRPGNPIEIKDGEVKNTTFSTPPVCILRLGDFYNTKIIIDSVNINYENLWDLNPEGIGVQPMIAKVSINFKFIGGSSMLGPVSRLQNALQYNFFANTELYQKFEKNSEKYIKYSETDTTYNKPINLGIEKIDSINSTPTISNTMNKIQGPIQILSTESDPPTPLRPTSKEYDDIEDRLIESKTGAKVAQGSKPPKRLDDGFENLPCYPNCPDDTEEDD